MDVSITIRGKRGEEVALKESIHFAAFLMGQVAIGNSGGTVIHDSNGHALSIPFLDIQEIAVGFANAA